MVQLNERAHELGSGRCGPGAAHFPGEALEDWCQPPAGCNLANGWPQCRCGNLENLSTRFGSALCLAGSPGALPNYRRQGPGEPARCAVSIWPRFDLLAAIWSRVSGSKLSPVTLDLDPIPLLVLPLPTCTHHPYSSHNLKICRKDIHSARRLGKSRIPHFVPILCLSCPVCCCCYVVVFCSSCCQSDNGAFPTLAWGPS